MITKDIQNLKAAFPYLFSNVIFECGNGWFMILFSLACELSKLSLKENVYPQCLQAKEKHGTLSFFIDDGTDEMFDLIEDAEMESFTTCELCGSKGELLNHNTIYMVRCKKCYSNLLSS
jgi:hypothetical protein